MKGDLRGRTLSSDDEFIGAVQNWLKTQPKNFFFLTKLKKYLLNAGTGAFKSPC
jgi:hypothetical protein